MIGGEVVSYANTGLGDNVTCARQVDKHLLELGPVRETGAYLDVVNIDRYDMIIGTRR